MSDVKLRVNMIIDGVFVKFGSFVDERKIPANLRKKRFIVRPGERDIDEIRFRAQASVAENDAGEEEASEEVEREEPLRSRVIQQRMRR